eukprot:995036-Rhodomonas_salina.2
MVAEVVFNRSWLKRTCHRVRNYQTTSKLGYVTVIHNEKIRPGGSVENPSQRTGSERSRSL